MQKFLMSAALVCSLVFGASAQGKKTTVKTKTTTETAPKQTVTETAPAPQPMYTQETTSSASTSSGGSEGGGDLKASGGDVTLEANVNILNSAVSLSNSLNQIRVRYFMSDDMALRLGGNLRFETDSPTPTIKTRTIDFSIAPGIEKHFAGTNRLSPYLGAELVVGFKSAHSEEKPVGGGTVEIKGSTGGPAKENRGNFLVGVGAVGGCDFYVAKHLYLGYELSLELSNRSYSEIETITTAPGGTVTTVKNEGTSNFSFGPNVRNGIRVGFVF